VEQEMKRLGDNGTLIIVQMHTREFDLLKRNSTFSNGEFDLTKLGDKVGIAERVMTLRDQLKALLYKLPLEQSEPQLHDL
jgi:hypothetical protein